MLNGGHIMEKPDKISDTKEKVFAPITINNLELKNRIFKAPTLECMATEAGAPTEKLTRFYKRAAKGGSGLMITGLSYVSKEGKGYLGQNGIYDDSLIPAWKDFTDKIHEADGKIVMQISHGGRQVDPRLLTDKKAKAPSNVPNIMYLYKAQKLEEDEIEKIIQEFGEAAGRVKKAGFDGVQIHSSGGYLLASFLSPITNRRKDEWGGDEKSRFHLFKKIYKSVRKNVGDDFPVFAKVHLGDFMLMGHPYPANYQAALWMQDLGVDALEIGMGIFENATITFAKGKMPVSIIDNHIGPFMRFYWKTTEWIFKPFSGFKKPYFQTAARQLKKHGLTIPLLLAGGVRRYDEAAAFLDEETADLIGMARPLLREPNLPNKWMQGNKADSLCISCNKCTFDMGVNGNPLKCHERSN
jgi:2,4-dienoyl-CoA reductase-like NADH-dependent reductase (Old Yellow Enzyme family)